MSKYAWIIDRDHEADPAAGTGTNSNAVGVTGPRAAPADLVARLKNGEGDAFRMFDDDDNLYYEGRLIGDSDGEEGFAPLDDFGMPNAGCTYIQYRSKTGKWETL